MRANQLPQAPEGIEQTYLFRWAILQECTYPELELLHHIPNGGKRDIGTARKLKREGVKPGVPDISLPVPRGSFHGLYIELKVNKNKTSEFQNRWIQALKNQGYHVAVCYGWEEASKEIVNYLKGVKSLEN